MYRHGGRVCTDMEKDRKLTIRVSKEDLDRLDRVSNGNQSEWIRSKIWEDVQTKEVRVVQTKPNVQTKGTKDVQTLQAKVIPSEVYTEKQARSIVEKYYKTHEVARNIPKKLAIDREVVDLMKNPNLASCYI